MSRPLRFAPAVSTIALASMIAGCAAPQQKAGVAARADENVGLATRAMLALNAHEVPAAVDFAERAVEHTPNDAGFRALLGNAYFAAGRFSSAEAAYKDSLTLSSNQPQVILKLALVETALGKKDEAIAFLRAGQSVLDPSNYGLALALAGDTDEAIPQLDAAARQPGADATVRQNLALAHALAGDWTEAKTIAAQDVPASQLDSRIHEWMQLASAKKPSDQVAALVGVTPAAVDAGEPVRLALRGTDTMMAAAAPAPRSAPAAIAPPPPSPQPQVAQVAPPVAAAPQPQFVEAVAAPAPVPQAQPAVASAPESMVSAAESIAAVPIAMISKAAHRAAAEVASLLPAKGAPVARPKAHRIPAAVSRGDSAIVMQIGSYGSPRQVSTGWSRLTQQFPALRAYMPLRARFDSPKGTFWRLSIQGFGTQREAIARCQALRSRGGHCFVRGAAGDKPVEIASN